MLRYQTPHFFEELFFPHALSLKKLNALLRNVTISGGGVLPFIHPGKQTLLEFN